MDGELYLGLVAISIILIRWYFITLSMYKRMLEFSGNEFQYKNHFMFKMLVRIWAIPMAIIAPARAMFKLSEFDILWQGVSDEQIKALMAVKDIDNIIKCKNVCGKAPNCGKTSCEYC